MKLRLTWMKMNMKAAGMRRNLKSQEILAITQLDENGSKRRFWCCRRELLIRKEVVRNGVVPLKTVSFSVK